jgi:hypothetical protein
MILEAFYNRCPLNLPEIRATIRTRFNQEILSDTPYGTLVRNHGIKSRPASPMDDERRAEVSDGLIREYFATLCQTVSGTPANFVWHMDEMGHQTWSDARDTIRFLPFDLSDTRVACPVLRTCKRIALIVCISSDGSYMCPALVISQHTFENELFLHGFTSEKIETHS